MDQNDDKSLGMLDVLGDKALAEGSAVNMADRGSRVGKMRYSSTDRRKKRQRRSDRTVRNVKSHSLKKDKTFQTDSVKEKKPMTTIDEGSLDIETESGGSYAAELQNLPEVSYLKQLMYKKFAKMEAVVTDVTMMMSQPEKVNDLLQETPVVEGHEGNTNNSADDYWSVSMVDGREEDTVTELKQADSETRDHTIVDYKTAGVGYSEISMSTEKADGPAAVDADGDVRGPDMSTDEDLIKQFYELLDVYEKNDAVIIDGDRAALEEYNRMCEDYMMEIEQLQAVESELIPKSVEARRIANMWEAEVTRQRVEYKSAEIGADMLEAENKDMMVEVKEMAREIMVMEERSDKSRDEIVADIRELEELTKELHGQNMLMCNNIRQYKQNVIRDVDEMSSRGIKCDLTWQDDVYDGSTAMDPNIKTTILPRSVGFKPYMVDCNTPMSTRITTYDHISRSCKEQQPNHKPVELDDKPVELHAKLSPENDDKPVELPVELSPNHVDKPVELPVELSPNHVDKPVELPVELSPDNVDKPVELPVELSPDNDKKPVEPPVELSPNHVDKPVELPVTLSPDNVDKPVELPVELSPDNDDKPVEPPVELSPDNVDKPVEMPVELPPDNVDKPVELPVELSPNHVDKPVELPVELSPDNDDKPVELPVELSPNHVDKPVELPVELSPDNVDKPVELPVELSPDNDDKPVEPPVELSPDNVDKPVELPVELSPDNVDKPVELPVELSPDNDDKPVELPVELSPDNDDKPVELPVELSPDNDDKPVELPVELSPDNDDKPVELPVELSPDNDDKPVERPVKLSDDENIAIQSALVIEALHAGDPDILSDSCNNDEYDIGIDSIRCPSALMALSIDDIYTKHKPDTRKSDSSAHRPLDTLLDSSKTESNSSNKEVTLDLNMKEAALNEKATDAKLTRIPVSPRVTHNTGAMRVTKSINHSLINTEDQAVSNLHWVRCCRTRLTRRSSIPAPTRVVPCGTKRCGERETVLPDKPNNLTRCHDYKREDFLTKAQIRRSMIIPVDKLTELNNVNTVNDPARVSRRKKKKERKSKINTGLSYATGKLLPKNTLPPLEQVPVNGLHTKKWEPRSTRKALKPIVTSKIDTGLNAITGNGDGTRSALETKKLPPIKVAISKQPGKHASPAKQSMPIKGTTTILSTRSQPARYRRIGTLPPIARCPASPARVDSCLTARSQLTPLPDIGKKAMPYHRVCPKSPTDQGFIYELVHNDYY